MPLYVAFIDLTKAFDLVSRAGLLKILAKIGCPSKDVEVVGSGTIVEICFLHVIMKGLRDAE